MDDAVAEVFFYSEEEDKFPQSRGLGCFLKDLGTFSPQKFLQSDLVLPKPLGTRSSNVSLVLAKA